MFTAAHAAFLKAQPVLEFLKEFGIRENDLDRSLDFKKRDMLRKDLKNVKVCIFMYTISLRKREIHQWLVYI